ncbi:hypothetical protein ACGFYU_06710 [Streptomyces sp. NPDC048337]|uniref:hypothetical protein n=1 Tax=Streptomyces sp. NPDC048337 TaxID=3365535 RepID=UPI00371D9D63
MGGGSAARADVQLQADGAAGRKRPRHPEAGLLTPDFETLHVPASPAETTGLVVHVFSADEGPPEAAALARPAGPALLSPGRGSSPAAGRG